MRENIPDAHLYDPELFTLEIMIRSRIKEQKIPLHIIMGEAAPNDNTASSSSSYEDDLDVRPRRSFDFTARLPNKNLRCVNINWAYPSCDYRWGILCWGETLFHQHKIR